MSWNKNLKTDWTILEKLHGFKQISQNSLNSLEKMAENWILGLSGPDFGPYEQFNAIYLHTQDQWPQFVCLETKISKLSEQFLRKWPKTEFWACLGLLGQDFGLFKKYNGIFIHNMNNPNLHVLSKKSRNCLNSFRENGWHSPKSRVVWQKWPPFWRKCKNKKPYPTF